MERLENKSEAVFSRRDFLKILGTATIGLSTIGFNLNPALAQYRDNNEAELTEGGYTINAAEGLKLTPETLSILKELSIQNILKVVEMTTKQAETEYPQFERKTIHKIEQEIFEVQKDIIELLPLNFPPKYAQECIKIGKRAVTHATTFWNSDKLIKPQVIFTIPQTKAETEKTYNSFDQDQTVEIQLVNKILDIYYSYLSITYRVFDPSSRSDKFLTYDNVKMTLPLSSETGMVNKNFSVDKNFSPNGIIKRKPAYWKVGEFNSETTIRYLADNPRTPPIETLHCQIQPHTDRQLMEHLSRQKQVSVAKVKNECDKFTFIEEAVVHGVATVWLYEVYCKENGIHRDTTQVKKELLLDHPCVDKVYYYLTEGIGKKPVEEKIPLLQSRIKNLIDMYCCDMKQVEASILKKT